MPFRVTAGWLILLPLVAQSEIKVLERNSSISTQFGGITAPGYVDVSGLTLAANTPGRWYTYKDDTVPIDVAIFPSRFCYPGSTGDRRCESWPDLGLCYLPSPRRRYTAVKCCCSSWDHTQGICPEEGRLIVDHDAFDGLFISTSVPIGGSIRVGDVLQDKSQTRFNVTISGSYAVYVANCHHLLQNSGAIVWKSRNGYLYGSLFLTIFLYAFLSGVYLVLLVAFSRAVREHQAHARTPDQKAILALMILGALQMVLSLLLFVDWNRTGHYSYRLSMLSVLVGGIKDGLLFPLIFLVALEEQIQTRTTTENGSRRRSSNNLDFLLMAALWGGVFRNQRTIAMLGLTHIVSSVAAQCLYAYYDTHYKDLGNWDKSVIEMLYPSMGVLAVMVMFLFFCKVLRLHRMGSNLSRFSRRRQNPSSEGDEEEEDFVAFDRSVKLVNALRFSVVLCILCFASALLADMAKVEDELRDSLCLIMAALQVNFCNMTAVVARHSWPSADNRIVALRSVDYNHHEIEVADEQQQGEVGDVELLPNDRPLEIMDPLVISTSQD